MADDVLDFLLAQFARQDEQHENARVALRELTQCAGAVEVGLASLHQDFANISVAVANLSVRLDHMGERLDRIERRLELTGAHSPRV